MKSRVRQAADLDSGDAIRNSSLPIIRSSLSSAPPRLTTSHWPLATACPILLILPILFPIILAEGPPTPIAEITAIT